MNRLGLSMEKVKAIFVSHEHGDHITGIPGLSKKFQLPVYITNATLNNGRLPIDENLVRCFNCNEPTLIEGFSVQAFRKAHDAADPHSFTITYNGTTIGIFTDIGFPCGELAYHFKLCHAAFLEANYDVDMLMNGKYPYHLKKRISGGNGHLSNKQALDVFKQHRPVQMSHLILAHLSKNNNCPDLVKNMFEMEAGETEIIVASRYEETKMLHIVATKANHLNVQPRPKKQYVPKPLQLALFA